MRRVIAGICDKHGYYQGQECFECIEEDSEVFYASKDKLWEFTDYHTTGKPVEIRSKRQWYQHLKQLNMHDDVGSLKRSIEREDKRRAELKHEQQKQLRESVKQAYADVKYKRWYRRLEGEK